MKWTGNDCIYEDTYVGFEEVRSHSFNSSKKLDVFDWLSDIPVSDIGKIFPIIEVSFNNGSRKEFFRNTTHWNYRKGDWVAVEGNGGFDVGEVCLSGELVRLQMKRKNVTKDSEDIKRVLRLANETDLELVEKAEKRQYEILKRSRIIAREQKLGMKITQIEVQADGRKISFFYTAEHRVDFRELIKIFASEFKAKIEMRQIGVRQEGAKLGGIGACGRELCCSAWLTDYNLLNPKHLSQYNLSVNQSKIAGQCGKLKYCLNFELDMYLDALKHFPKNADKIDLAPGRAILQKKDIFRNLMWYSYEGSNKQYPLTIERVEEIVKLNAEGIKPEEMQEAEVTTHKLWGDEDSKADMGFVNDVGQISLNSLRGGRGRGNRKKKKSEKPDYTPNRNLQAKSQSTKGEKKQKPNKVATNKTRSNQTTEGNPTQRQNKPEGRKRNFKNKQRENSKGENKKE